MAISARLSAKTLLGLTRYCKTHGLTKTEALERGIHLLLRSEGDQEQHHAAWRSFERLHVRGSVEQVESVQTLKRHLDEKYPG